MVCDAQLSCSGRLRGTFRHPLVVDHTPNSTIARRRALELVETLATARLPLTGAFLIRIKSQVKVLGVSAVVE